MKRLCIKITSLFFIVSLAVCSAAFVCVFKASAATDDISKLKINDSASVDVGKTVTYTLYLSDATDPILGFQLQVFYDSDYLEYQVGSRSFENFEGVFINEKLSGKIPMNYTHLDNQPLFDTKKQFVSLDFTVKKGGSANITYFFTDLYGEDMGYLKSYKLTYDLVVDGEAVVKDAVPLVNSDDDVISAYEGDFVNYSDGMGEENSPQEEQNHVRIGNGIKTDVIEVTKGANAVNLAAEQTKNDGGDGVNWFRLIIILLIVSLVIAAIVFAVIYVNKKNNADDI